MTSRLSAHAALFALLTPLWGILDWLFFPEALARVEAWVRTLPIGMKLFEDVEAMRAIPGLRRAAPGKRLSTCQLVTPSRART